MLEPDVEKMNAELETILGSIDLSDIKSKGISLRIGGKNIQFGVQAEEVINDEDKIRDELKLQVNAKMLSIKEAVNEKIFEIKKAIEDRNKDNEIRLERSISDANEREEQARIKLNDSTLMPEITLSHAKKGLSVVKGRSNNGGTSENAYTFLFAGQYWPKTYNGKPLKERIVKKMVTPVILEIKAYGSAIEEIIVRTAVGFKKFKHYHGYDSSDCWGNWKYSQMSWNTPDDIIKIGENALAVLENINGASLATSRPAGLPRPATLEKNIIEDEDGVKAEVPVSAANTAASAAGVSVEAEVMTDNVWSTATTTA